jgi:hypothetical protein
VTDGSKHNFILDCVNFYHNTQEAQPFNKDIFIQHIESLKNVKSVLYVIDLYMLLQLLESQVVKNITDKGNNLLSKLFVLDKTHMLCGLYIQKFENNKCDFDNLKVILHEIYDDLSLTKPLPIMFKHLEKSLKYMYQMYQYQGYFKELRPGTVTRININETFWSDNVEFTMTLVDSANPVLVAKNDCKAIIVGKSHSSDFLYINREGNLQLCEQVEASRLLIFRPSPFNHDSTDVIKQKIEHYILLFKFKSCVNENIPILMMSDPKTERYEVYSDSKMTVQDVEDESKNIFRQLIFNDNVNEIQSEIKLVPVFNERIKKESEHIPLPTTIKRFLEKKMRLCLDDKFIGSYYIKSVLAGLFFLKDLAIEKNQPEVLILGSGIGTIDHFLGKMLGGKVKITSVELDKKIVDIGKEYFGFGAENSVIADAKKYVLDHSKEVNKYDLIIIDINNTDQSQGISPPPVFFDRDYLNAIHAMLKDTGCYIINLMARSIKSYISTLKELEETFPLVFMVENNEDLNKIHFCFKSKLDNQEYHKIYIDNSDNITAHGDFSVIGNDVKRILSKVTDLEELKKTFIIN